MDWREFTASLVASLSWPIVVVVALVLFRGPLLRVLPLIERLRYRDLEIAFTRRVLEVSADVEREIVDGAGPETGGELSRIKRLAETSTRAAILEAWLLVEDAAMEAGQRLGSSGPPRSVLNLIRYLETSGQLDAGVSAILRELRGIRNEAAHVPTFSPPQDLVNDYAEAALRVRDHLRLLDAR